jgi:putative tributyrin esterase
LISPSSTPTDTYRLPETDALKSRSHGLFYREKNEIFVPGMKFQTVISCSGGVATTTRDLPLYQSGGIRATKPRGCSLPEHANSFGAATLLCVPYQTIIRGTPPVIQTLFASSPKREDNFSWVTQRAET